MNQQTEQKENFKNICPKPVVLIILDGWGVAPDSFGNVITIAKTPNFDRYCREYFCSILQASGEAVGLPYGEIGSSEVGHINIGAGKIIYQDLPRINKAIIDGSFATNPFFLKACKNVHKNKSSLHLIGLLSDGGVHASVEHLYALLEIAKGQNLEKVFVHVILDGRDMAYNSGLELIESLEHKMKEIGIGKIATISGRFWSMDRDNRWDRTEKAYNAIALGDAENFFSDPLEAVKVSYSNKKYDEEMEPVIINKTKIISDDSVIFFNFRPDRARQLTKAFVLPGFDKFKREVYLQGLFFVTMTQYEKNLSVSVAFPPDFVEYPLARILSENDLKQLHVSETEKYAHVTYFFNGGAEKVFNGEKDILVPSPKVDSYDKKPEMSAREIKTIVLKEIQGGQYDFMVINFANADMVGHTGAIKATVKAVETVDKCLGEIVVAVLEKQGVVIITSDHGNAEELINQNSGEIIKEHSTNPVPFIVVGNNFRRLDVPDGGIDLTMLTPSGVLADVSPTILKIMGIEKPKDMTGQSLV
ncbi:MAG: 2,3-bisphosphoglycerate-independent phosphoglycerate mutase [Patescibacteria group bacterium]